MRQVASAAGLRYTDIDDKRVVAQRPHGGQTNGAVNVARPSIIPAALGNEPMPRRVCGQLVMYAIRRVGVTHDDGAVAVQ